MDQGHKGLTVVLICAALALVTFVAYEQVRNHDFVDYDDKGYVYENQHVKTGLTSDSIRWAFTTRHARTYWHPLTWLSHMLDCQLFGTNPGWHHLTNVLLHIANTLLLFIVLKRMTRALWCSAFVAAAFALHPLHVESVAWVAERKDVLSSFFWMLTIWAYIRYTEHPGLKRYLLILLFFILGLMAKPMLVTLPFALLLLDYWPLGRLKWAGKDKGENISPAESASLNRRVSSTFHLVVEKIPLFVLSAVLCVVTFLSPPALAAVKRLPLNLRTENAVVSYVSYIGKLIYPSRLAVFYPHPLGSLPIWKPIVCFLILIVVSVIVLYRVRSKRFLIVGWLWYLGTLIPVIGLVQVGDQAMADRYTYLPSIGIFIIVAWGVAELSAKWRYRKIILGILAGLILAVLVICTRAQVKYWKNDFTLFKHALEVTQNNAVVHERYASAIFKEGKFDEARSHYKQALRIRPEIFQAHAGLGLIFLKQGKIDEAIACFEDALRLKPDYALGLNNLGALLADQGKIGEAVRYFEKTIQSNPDYPMSYYNMAKVKIRQKEYDQAVKYLESALQRKPDWPKVCSELGEAYYFSFGNVNQAVRYWRRALELNPVDIKSLNNLAWVLATTQDTKLRNPADAVKYAERMIELVEPYQQPILLDALAAAYAAAGDFSKAVKTAEEAIKLLEAAGKKDAAEKMLGRLELYKSGQPYRER